MSALFTVFAVVATCSLVSAQDSSSLTNDDVIKLVQAGLPSAVILAKISSSSTDFDTSVEALLALSAAGIPSDVLTAMAEAGKQAPTPSPPPVAPAPPETAQTHAYTPDQIGAAVAIGADGGGESLVAACEAGTRRRRGLLGRIAGNRAVQSYARGRVGGFVDGYISRAVYELWSETGVDILPEVRLAVNVIAEAVAKRKADGTLPPLPSGIRVTGQSSLARVAEHTLQVHRLNQPLPQPDSADVAAIIGKDLFEVRVLDYVAGLEYIVIRSRGGDDEQAVAHPVSLEVGDSAMVAQFASDDLKRIAEDDNVEATVFTASGEFRCDLDARKIRRGFNPI